MNNGFTVCSWCSESPSELVRARKTSRRRPAVVEVAFIHGGTLFTNGKDTGAAEFGKKDLAGVLVNVNQYLGGRERREPCPRHDSRPDPSGPDVESEGTDAELHEE
jgi:hypothetical protein